MGFGFYSGKWRMGTAVLIAFFCAEMARAQDLTPDEFDQLSLKYRTAIHYDPLLQQPIDSLVKLYRDAKRTDELVGLYRSHVEKYPDDAGSKTALIRLLRKVDRSGADELIASAVPLHPEFAPLQYLLYNFLSERGDERAVETLSRAIDLEVNPAKRRDWLEELLQIAESDESRELARIQLEKLFLAEYQSADSLLSLAGLMQRFGYYELSILALNRIAEYKPSPEVALEVEILLANAEYELGDSAAAGARLDAVILKLAPDHWRRREIMSQRVNVLASPEERAVMLERAAALYGENQESEALILDYVELLVASEKQAEAAKLLVDRSELLPGSAAIEARALEVLEEVNDVLLYEKYLAARLEQQPDRSDLRFRLVKVHYANGRDADAEQDFKAVVAGLEPDDVSEKILELQRYLRRINRINAAVTYLERYLRNHPVRLDVARELAEIYVSQKKPDQVNILAGKVDSKGSEVENLIDFVEFLIGEGFPVGAKLVLQEKLAEDPSHFEMGLLLIEAESELGDRAGAQLQIDRVRELADSAPRYSKWLETALRASAKFELVENFYSQEQGRYSFSDGVWSQEKVERFMLLCEFGKQRLFTERVAAGIREQLEQTSLESDLRLRLKRFLVSVLESETSATDEVIALLEDLKSADPANEIAYQLRIGMAHHRSLRLDYSQQILAEVDYSEVESADLLRSAVPILMEYGFHDEAGRALEAVNRLEASDVFSWEKRLGILAASGKEKVFRSVIRSLRSGEAGLKLRASTDVVLRDHLLSSYYRSMGDLLHPGTPAEMEALLPFLSSIDREEMEPEARLWSLWSRAFILADLGRAADAAGAKLLFQEQLENAGVSAFVFPDGLILEAKAAVGLLDQIAVAKVEEGSGDASFLLQQPEIGWAFEISENSRIVRFAESGDVILVLDDHSVIHAIDKLNGKLLWRESFSSRKAVEASNQSLWSLQESAAGREAGLENSLSAKDAPSFHSDEDSFLIAKGETLQCFESRSAKLKWSAVMPFVPHSKIRGGGGGSLPGTVFDSNALYTIVYRADTREAAGYDRGSGKLQWYRQLGEVAENANFHPLSLNSGVSVGLEMVFLYGYGSEILETATGETVWSFAGAPHANFPITVREAKIDTEELSEDDIPELTTTSDPGLSKQEEVVLLQFSTPEEKGNLPFFLLEAPSVMVSPSVYWSGTRLINGEGAFASLSGGNLWLTQNESVRKVSTSMPLITEELTASGALIAIIGNHAWFLKGNELIHADFLRNRTSKLVFDDLGKKVPLRTAVAGNQIVVRGEIGIKVVNGLTSQVIGQTLWEDSLLSYLKSFAGDGTGTSKEGWRGRINRRDRNDPGLLSPVTDLVSEGNYFTTFSQRSLICLRLPEVVPPTAVVPAVVPAN